MKLFDYARLDPADRAVLEETLAGHVTLADVLDWGAALHPPLRVESVLTQDEYTHDVLMPYGSRYLVYDTS